MKKLILILCLLPAFMVKAQNQKIELYIETYKETAIREMMRTGVPAAITLAQGIHESQSGESNLAKNSNNHFGIKCKTEWTGRKIYADDDARGECFRAYDSAGESYKDHSDFLKTRPHYAFLFALDPADFEGWAMGLKKAGYATNPSYPQKLTKLINDYNLQQYSLQALTRLQNGNPADKTAIVASTPTRDKKTRLESVQTKPETLTTPTVTSIETMPLSSYPDGVFDINRTKVLYGKAGTSMLSLANTYDLPLHKLFEYNDIEDMDVLDTDCLIFIERKPKKGATEFHTVAEGETLHHISQIEGVRLESLLTYNNLKKSTTLLTGDKVYLRAPSQSTSIKDAKSTRKNTRR